ncbi:NFACT family protein [bacterium]|nr:NFACT family protein [bacterium]
MINFDALTLKLFYEETKDFFFGAKIQKIQQPTRSELIFHIRNIGETRKLYINFNPNFYHICFMSKENENKRNLVLPKSALMFCMLLRKYIQNAKIIKVEVPKYERIFEIYFEYYDELNEKSQLCLAIELMGKYSNVILYNYDTNVIIGCAHNVSAEKSRERELYGMLPYVYPSKQKKKNLLKTDFATFKSTIDAENIAISIASKYHYLTTSLVQDIIDTIKPFNLQKLFDKLTEILKNNDFNPCISNDYSKYYVIRYENTFDCGDINSMIDEYFSFHQEKQIIQNVKNKIVKYSNAQLNKLYGLKIKQEQQISKLNKALEYKNKADIIMSNLYCIKQGQKDAELFDFEGNKISIELDENKTPTENANKYYALYKKTKTAFGHASEMVKETDSQILYFEEIKYFTESTDNVEELNDIYNEINEEQVEIKEKQQIVEYIEYLGYKIYVGKNKKQNDYILSKLSSAEDIWFHPLNAAGAHVIVKRNNTKEEPDEKVILKAAQLTKEYSSQKNNSKTPIIYTKRKYVKKANNKLAFVTYKNESEIVV